MIITSIYKLSVRLLDIRYVLEWILCNINLNVRYKYIQHIKMYSIYLMILNNILWHRFNQEMEAPPEELPDPG